MEASYNYKKGLPAMLICYVLWGFQPLYYAIDSSVDDWFLLASRVFWAAVCCLIILAAQGKLGELKAVFTNRATLRREIPASLLLLADWGIYLFAVRDGKVMECAMGYYIMPLVMVAFGALMFREKLRRLHLLALGFIVVGIVLSAEGFGGFPAVTVTLAICFAVYSALKKTLTADSIVTTTAEILLMLPLAVIYTLVFARGPEGLSGISFSRELFLAGSGLVTGLPMVFFAIGIEHLPLSLAGIFQYLSPTLGLICSRILGESFTKEKLISFCFIWAGVGIYTACELLRKNKA